jgi:twitching motility protein PilI
MSGHSQIEPILLLQDIDQRSREHAQGLPQQIEVKSTWDGVGFRLGNLRLVAPLDDVLEIFPYPRLTRVPGAKNWLKGIANVRGTLLPINDLVGFLGLGTAELGRQARVMVVRHKAIMVGLVVDEVLGMRHFPEEERTEEMPSVDEQVSRYLHGAFRQEGRLWGVFSMQTLVESTDFVKVAA